MEQPACGARIFEDTVLKRWNWRWSVAAVLVLALIGAGVTYSWQRPISVHVAMVEKDVPIQVFGLGTVEAQTVSQIGFETAGTLIELKADHGDTVKAGALLARLQSREQEARTAQARAAITQAEAAVAQSSSAVEKAEAVLKQKAGVSARRHQLVERGVVSQETAEDTLSETEVAKADLSQAQSGIIVARANLEQAKAMLALEEARLAKYSLFAPFDAIVISRHRELGSALNANEAVFTLVDPATIWALAYIDEAMAGGIEIGQLAQVTRRSAPDFRMQAKVARIDIESDRVNEERRVYVRCGGCPLTFHLGEQAEVLITVATLPSARLVKLKSLANLQRREATAWTIEDGRLEQRAVTLGARTLDGRVEITGGVPDGAEIVDDTVPGLKSGRWATIANGLRP
jgi:HlyD family secretion protein